MTRSTRIAALIGPTLVVLAVSEAVNLDIWKPNSPPVTYLNGTLLFVAGLAIVRAHNRWVRRWPVVITITGWLAIALGLFRMFAPKAQQGAENVPTYAVIAGVLALGIFLTVKAYTPPGGRDRFRTWMYRGERPNPLAPTLNGAWKLVGLSGLSRRHLNVLEVRGRRSGRPISLPVMVADHEGERYLVSMLGERSRWVANVRAASGHAVLRHGGREPVVLEEVAVEARAPILRRHVQIAPGGRSHIPAEREAPPEAFERIAPQYPVFRVRPDTEAAGRRDEPAMMQHMRDRRGAQPRTRISGRSR